MSFDPFKDPFSFGSLPSPSKDIFSKSPVTGGFRTGRKAPDSGSTASESSDTSDPVSDYSVEPAALEPGKKYPKVILRNPRWETAEVGFNEEAEVSVEAELPPEVAHKTKIVFALFAKTPSGHEHVAKAEGNVQGNPEGSDSGGKTVGRAKARLPIYIPQYRDADGNHLGKVEYFFTAQHSDSDLLEDEATVLVVERMAERLIASHVLEELTFAAGRSFPRPGQAQRLKALGEAVQAWATQHPEGKVAVFGHTDAMGREQENKALSERRAGAVRAFLAKEPSAWEALYGEEKWGLASTQELLKHLGHDAGAIDGQDGPKTQEAVKQFQGRQGLKVDGVAGPRTREALYLAFMESCGSPASKAGAFDTIDGKAFAGCSEFNLAMNTEGPEEANRRVAVLLLKSNRNFPIQYPCKHGEIAPCRAQAGRKGDRRTAGFRCLFYDRLAVEKAALVPKPMGTLKWTHLEDGEVVRQYVNLDSDHPGQGPERILEVECEGLVDVAKVYWKVAAGKDNGRRNDPKTGLKADPKGALMEFKDGIAEIATMAKGGKAQLVRACGLAGGDQFTVTAGLEKGKAEVTAGVVNWRKLYYEIMAPDFMHFEERTEAGGSKATDLTAAMLERLRERAGKVFVEYTLYKAHLFTEAEAPEGSVYTKEQMLLGSGGQAYLLTDHTFKSYPKNFDKGMAPRAIGLKLCDLNFFYESFDPNIIDEIVEMKSKSVQIPVGDWYKALFLPKSAENGQDSMKLLTWTAKIDPAKYPEHPAVSGGKARSGTLSLDCIKFTNIREFGVELPSTRAEDPGHLVGASVTADKCPIEVRMRFESPYVGLGLAGQGAQTGENLVVYNADSPECTVDVLLHELGHSMGQTVFGSKKPPKGLPKPKTISEVDSKYSSNGTLGHVYTKHGHSGPHCAYGLSDSQKGLNDYSGKGGICILFGENPGYDPSPATAGFCPQCSDYIKARDLRDLTVVLE